MAHDSLLLLELITLVLEHWATSYTASDVYLLGLIVSILEVLIHSESFWARLK